MMQRGEVGGFVAIRIGRANDVREVRSFSDFLGVSFHSAFFFLCAWEEWILEVGDARTGRVRGYTSQNLADKLTYRGDPRRLIKAMKRCGLLKIQRKTFIHPYWLETTTGRYALARVERRQWETERKRDAREIARSARDGQGSVPPLSQGRPMGHVADSHGTTDREREREGRGDGSAAPPPDGSAGPPNPPPGGGGTGAERWDWCLKHHPGPQNRRLCTPKLGRLAPEAWELFKFAVGAMGASEPPMGTPLSLWKRARGMNLKRFLDDEVYFRFTKSFQLFRASKNTPIMTEQEKAKIAEEKAVSRLQAERVVKLRETSAEFLRLSLRISETQDEGEKKYLQPRCDLLAAELEELKKGDNN